MSLNVKETIVSEWYLTHKDNYKNYYRKQRSEEPLYKYVYKKLQQRQRKLKEPFLFFSSEELKEWLDKQELKCVYCSVGLTHWDKRPETTITLDRIDNSRGYYLDNVLLACVSCNTMRSDVFSVDEMKLIGSVVGVVWKKRGF